MGDEYDGNVVVRLTSDRREFSIEVNGSRLLPLRGMNMMARLLYALRMCLCLFELMIIT